MDTIQKLHLRWCFVRCRRVNRRKTDTSQRPKYCHATKSNGKHWSGVRLSSNMVMTQVTLRQWLGQSEAPEHFPKRKLHQKRVTLPVWWVASGTACYKYLKSYWNHSFTEVLLWHRPDAARRAKFMSNLNHWIFSMATHCFSFFQSV